ncbi:NUDIX hydrolase [Actinacidiphila glaucinigra]|uniref:NUDIX hydrolase n=1 Tax=Actinacidiphila glaucinigra TaxID=235986 RepID=UPI002E349866|nr:NUDIX domain-containing protein [Actinacidiphila glaucinigra]
MTDLLEPGGFRDASVVVARDEHGLIAVLSAPFPQHGGEYLFLPGGRREAGEDALKCAQRELREEAGITATQWHPLGAFLLSMSSQARVHLFAAEVVHCGTQELTDTEEGFTLQWWPLAEVIGAAQQGRFLLQGGPLALLLAQQHWALQPV